MAKKASQVKVTLKRSTIAAIGSTERRDSKILSLIRFTFLPHSLSGNKNQNIFCFVHPEAAEMASLIAS